MMVMVFSILVVMVEVLVMWFWLVCESLCMWWLKYSVGVMISIRMFSIWFII